MTTSAQLLDTTTWATTTKLRFGFTHYRGHTNPYYRETGTQSYPATNSGSWFINILNDMTVSRLPPQKFA